jgi:ABC-type transport system involved in multi-copper enzyme maturation permease subunit
VAIGLAASSLATTRAQAVAAAVALWILFALGVDLALAALAPSVRLGAGWIMVAILLNPLEAARILALLGTNLEGAALGPFGAYAIGTFGTAGTVAILLADLVAWAGLSLGVARAAIRRMDP